MFIKQFVSIVRLLPVPSQINYQTVRRNMLFWGFFFVFSFPWISLCLCMMKLVNRHQFFFVLLDVSNSSILLRIKRENRACFHPPLLAVLSWLPSGKRSSFWYQVWNEVTEQKGIFVLLVPIYAMSLFAFSSLFFIFGLIWFLLFVKCWYTVTS